MENLPARLKSVYADLSHFSVVILIAANLAPLYGVLFLGWQVFPLLFLYWFENVIIGLFNLLKMVACKPRDRLSKKARIGAMLFFCIHYGLFTFVHGIFVFVVFGSETEVLNRAICHAPCTKETKEETENRRKSRGSRHGF